MFNPANTKANSYSTLSESNSVISQVVIPAAFFGTNPLNPVSDSKTQNLFIKILYAFLVSTVSVLPYDTIINYIAV